MYYALAASQLEALRHHVELILFAGGYAGLQLVEADRAVLCALLPAARLRAVGGRWSSLLDALMDECPHLRERLAGARATARSAAGDCWPAVRICPCPATGATRPACSDSAIRLR